MYERLVKTFNEMKVRYEIIFVNDNSPDNTDEVLDVICAKDPNVIAIKHSRNFGSQSAFLSGMEICYGRRGGAHGWRFTGPARSHSEVLRKMAAGFRRGLWRSGSARNGASRSFFL
jgi:glycosyltransferase involved in cell wall biosynthesis